MRDDRVSRGYFDLREGVQNVKFCKVDRCVAVDFRAVFDNDQVEPAASRILSMLLMCKVGTGIGSYLRFLPVVTPTSRPTVCKVSPSGELASSVGNGLEESD